MVGLWSSLSKMVISVVEGWVFLFLMLAFPATPSQIACEVYMNICGCFAAQPSVLGSSAL